MRNAILLALGCVLVVMLGCSRQRPVGPVSTGDEPKANASLLVPLIAKEKLADARPVIDVRDKAKDGDEVVVIGTVPPDNVKPFNDTLAVIRLMDPRDLEDPTVKEEFACDVAAT